VYMHVLQVLTLLGIECELLHWMCVIRTDQVKNLILQSQVHYRYPHHFCTEKVVMWAPKGCGGLGET
jgi:hypothetical protein